MPDNLDPTDRQILELLQRDAELSTTELAERVHLSQSPCWRRINRLQKEGYIKGKYVLLEPEKLGLTLVVYAHVQLSSHGHSNLREFEQAMLNYPQVTECYIMAGTMDYMLRIITRGMEGYERFLREQLLPMPQVREVHSNVTIRCIKRTIELPLE